MDQSVERFPTAAAETPSPSPFLLLPRELRDIVYGWVVCPDLFTNHKSYLSHALLTVSKQTHHEYMTTIFSFLHYLHRIRVSGYMFVEDDEQQRTIIPPPPRDGQAIRQPCPVRGSFQWPRARLDPTYLTSFSIVLLGYGNRELACFTWKIMPFKNGPNRLHLDVRVRPHCSGGEYDWAGLESKLRLQAEEIVSKECANGAPLRFSPRWYEALFDLVWEMARRIQHKDYGRYKVWSIMKDAYL